MGLLYLLYIKISVLFQIFTPIEYDHTPPSSTEVKERIESTFTPRLGRRGLFQGELYLYLYPLNMAVL